MRIGVVAHKAKSVVSASDYNHKKIEVSDLPCLPEALCLLLDRCNRDNDDVGPAAAVAGLDPGLTAQLLDAAFSVSNHKQQKFISLGDALGKLGFSHIRTIAVHAAVSRVFDRGSAWVAFDLAHYWRKALRGALLAQLLARKTGYAAPQEAYLAGLLRDIGQLMMLARHAREYDQVLHDAKAVSELMLAEKTHFGTTHLDVAEQLIRRWQLNSFMPDAVLYQHHALEAVQGAHPLVKIINLAAHLANRTGRLSEPQFDHAGSLLHIGNDQLVELVEEAERATDQAAVDLGLAAAGQKGGPGTSGPYTRLASHVRTFALLSMASADASKLSSADGALATLAEQLRVAFGFNTPIAFVRDAQRDCMLGRPLMGQSELIGQLEISLQHGRSLAAESAQGGRLLHSFDTELHGRRSVVDEQITRLSGGSGILCIPLMHRGTATAIVVIGIEESDLARVRADEASLKAFAAQAAQAIASIHTATDARDGLPGDAISMSQTRLRKVIHEVNNPLGIMKNYIKILRLKMNKEDPAQFGLGVIDEEIDRIARIVGGLTQTAETPSLIEEPVNINLLIFDLVRITTEPLLVRDSIRLKTELDHAVKPLRGDKNKLKQVLVNLVKNAAESMVGGGEIVISTRDEVEIDGANYVEIVVTDSGPGLPRDVLEHLFEPVSSTKGGEHFGLGLSIVNGLVREMGGTIRCSSDNKNGTRFQILLPSMLSVA